jgi:hypothetical protein
MPYTEYITGNLFVNLSTNPSADAHISSQAIQHTFIKFGIQILSLKVLR